MQDKDTITRIENAVDDAFASKLEDIGYAQAVWTLLSVNEDYSLKVTHQASDLEEMHIFADVHLNALTYPLQRCLKKSSSGTVIIRRELINEDYQLALDWIRASKDYSHFCSLFPLWHRQKIDVAVEGKRLVVNRPPGFTREYEAYNRLVKKEGKAEVNVPKIHEDLEDLLRAATTVSSDSFSVKFNRKLVSMLVSSLSPVLNARFSLPDDWAFGNFTLRDYRLIFVTIQSMLCAWQDVRTFLAAQRMPGLGYKSAVWIIAKDKFVVMLANYTNIRRTIVEEVLGLITFGSNGINWPDIATQPLVDLRNDSYALSPFVWLNSAAERNLCALLNQVPKHRDAYSRLTNQKEGEMRKEIIEVLSHFGFDFEKGIVQGTDVDLAIIDRKSKVCLCLELKWFIEPAEIREVVDRSKDLQDGIEQARKLNALHQASDQRLVKDILKIDASYSFLSVVVSRNWIGHDEIRCSDVPIIKVWHLLNKIKECKGALLEPLVWLRDREYLPKHNRDYSIVPTEIACGEWRANWYGIKPLAAGEKELIQPAP